MSVNVREAKKSSLLAVKDRNGDITRVIAPNATQIGLEQSPATLILTGNVTLPVKKATVTDAAAAKIYAKNSNVVIEVSNDTIHQPYVYLPGDPEIGQIHIVKDDVGYAASVNIVVQSVKNGINIDGASNTSLTTAYSSLTLLWDGEQWITINSGSGGGGGGVAPTTSTYVTLSTDATLTNERVLTAGTGIGVTDNGSGSTVVIGLLATGVSAGTYASPSSITVNAAGQITAITAGSGGGGGGDPDAQYLTLATTASLSAERVFTPGTGLSGTDGGVGGAYTLSINNNVVATISGSTFTGATKHNAGLSGSHTALIDGTAFIRAGAGVQVTTGSGGFVQITNTSPGDPGASYLVLSNTASLSNESAFAVGTGLGFISTVSTYTVFVKDSVVATISGSTFSGAVKFNGGLSGSHTQLVDGTSYLIAGPNVTITSQSNGSVVISSTGDGDPSAQYLVLSATASLSNERVFTPGTGLTATDAGANSSYTLGIDNSVVATISGSTFTGPTTHVTASSPLFIHTATTTSSSYSRTLTGGQANKFVATVNIPLSTSKTFTVQGNGNGAVGFDFWLSVNEPGFSVMKKYTVASQYNGDVVYNKIVDSGPYTGFDTAVVFTKSAVNIVQTSISHNYSGTVNVAITLDVPASSTGATTIVTIF